MSMFNVLIVYYSRALIARWVLYYRHSVQPVVATLSSLVSLCVFTTTNETNNINAGGSRGKEGEVDVGFEKGDQISYFTTP